MQFHLLPVFLQGKWESMMEFWFFFEATQRVFSVRRCAGAREAERLGDGDDGSGEVCLKSVGESVRVTATFLSLPVSLTLGSVVSLKLGAWLYCVWSSVWMSRVLTEPIVSDPSVSELVRNFLEILTSGFQHSCPDI